uniref:Uncharacterized protein n=1 Tax=Cacopsylla melanoneura TaxID=428564 RepID=A0A8D9F3Z1_9HEMI
MSNVWTHDGRILIKDGTKIHTVTSSRELQNLSVQKMKNLSFDPSSSELPVQQRAGVTASASNNSSFATPTVKPAPPGNISNIPIPTKTKPKPKKKSPVAQKYNRNKNK